MFGFRKAAKARRVAIALIAPLVENSRRRLGGIPEQSWSEPYLLGFMTMLISLIVKVETDGTISDEMLGLAQLEAFSQISGQNGDNIGEQICMLSAGRDALFGAGCENALEYMKALSGQGDPADPVLQDLSELETFDLLPNIDDSVLAPGRYARNSPLALALWVRHFEGNIA